MIEVRQLDFEYPSKRVLHNISFDVDPGAITALVGPNGAGKTTLLRCLAALARPYHGTVRIEGFDVAKDPRQVHRRLGYLPDFYGLYDELSVERCLYFAARQHGLDTATAGAAVGRAAARVGLSDRRREPAGELSRGLRQRLAIAHAIVHEPAVLLLDEPAAGLDPEARRKLSDLLVDLRAGGMTLIVSSHILAELEDYCTEMLVLQDGRIAGGGAVGVGQSRAERLTVALARPHPAFAEILAAQEGVRVIAADGTSAEVTFDGDPAAQHALLRALLDRGLAVYAMSRVRQRLEDTYFEKAVRSRAGDERTPKSDEVAGEPGTAP